MTWAGSDEAAGQGLEDLLAFIRDARGFDFTGYKRPTLARRIRKRFRDVGAADFADYRDRLESDAGEFGNLFNTILINVTGFFRDAEAWAFFERTIMPGLTADAGQARDIRVWSAGCATGEEAYSLAIAFAEALGIEECARRVKIYGTDIDQDALVHARAGSYPAKALESVPGPLRERYFRQHGLQFTVRPDLRRRVIFGRHDLTRDAPVSRVDLLACRNTLMYFNVEAQAQVIDRFHAALREGGCLFLGKAEMLLSDGERFEAASMRHRIFRRRPGTPTAAGQTTPARQDVTSAPGMPQPGTERDLRDLALEAAPFAMIGIDAGGTVVMVNDLMRAMSGMTARDIGRPFRDLEISGRPAELRPLIEQACAEHRMFRLHGVEWPAGPAEVRYLDIHVQPLRGPDGRSAGVVVTFVDTSAVTRLQLEITRSREDLDTTHGELQAANEELETVNEELQSSIEELETTNEELQSTNEELETVNEELQSGIGELETVNEQLQSGHEGLEGMNGQMRARIAELDETRAFLERVLSTVAAGVVVLDADFLVRSWSTGAEELWGLRAGQVLNQPFFGLDFGLPAAQVRDIVQDCLASGKRAGPVQVGATSRTGRPITCTVVCSPLRGSSQDGAGRDGAVLLMEETRPG